MSFVFGILYRFRILRTGAGGSIVLAQEPICCSDDMTYDSIAKRCPNGKWKDDDGQCIPIEEWKAKHHRNSPKEKTEADIKNKDRAERIRELRTHYGIDENARKELKRFYRTGIRNDPLKRAEEGVKMIEKAIDDPSISLDNAIKPMINNFDGDTEYSYSDLDRVKDPEIRKAFLTGVKNVAEVCPFASVSIPSLSLENLRYEGALGQTWLESGAINLDASLYVTELSDEDYEFELYRTYKPSEV